MSGWNDLHRAAADGRVGDATKLLAAGHATWDVNQADGRGETPLVLAAARGHVAMVDFLCAHHDADVAAATNDGVAPLHAAAAAGHAAVCERLVTAHGADVNQRRKDGATALLHAARAGDADMVRRLLRLGADVDLGDQDGATPITVAKGETLRIFMARPEGRVHVNRADKEGRSALWHACQEGDVETAALLLSNGADENQLSLDGLSPLDAAQQQHNNTEHTQELVHLLRRYGAKARLKRRFLWCFRC